MSSLGGTILLHELVRPEASLEDHPTRGLEVNPSILAHLSHFSIMKPKEVLDHVHGSLHLEQQRQLLQIIGMENLKPTRGWVCVRPTHEEWQVVATNIFILSNFPLQVCKVMHLFGVHRSQHLPQMSSVAGIVVIMGYPTDPLLWRWDWISPTRQPFVIVVSDPVEFLKAGMN